jgi:hypothetical protein
VTARALRVNQAYFEERRVRGRDMGEFTMTADQVFEMLFMVGSITPSHAGILLLLFGAIPLISLQRCLMRWQLIPLPLLATRLGDQVLCNLCYVTRIEQKLSFSFQPFLAAPAYRKIK